MDAANPRRSFAPLPRVLRWPGKIDPGTSSDELTSTIDVLPTFAGLAGSTPPEDRIIDGKDISPLLFGDPAAKTPHDVFYYYAKDELQAVRSGDWKLQLPRNVQVRYNTGTPPKLPLQLYNLSTDIGETRNMASSRPEVVSRLQNLADQAREDLGDGDRVGKNQRAAGFVPEPQPLTE
jgi:arylsulfatase A-like enzyme